jgi:4-diphosphocytidyl-2-C-methyl-D-erythritol kinase
MYLRREEFTRTVRAPAKLNLYLEVFGRRGDGFHELVTLMVPVRLWDSVTMRVTPAADHHPGDIRLRVRSCLPARSPPLAAGSVPTGAQNLVVRALELLRERSGCAKGAELTLIKRIPSAAGLGGGSSDAAAALRLGNQLWQLGWSQGRLAKLAAELGSDVPYFLSGGAAICRGRGERVDRLPGVPPLHFVLAKPPEGLSTADVYRALDVLPEHSPRSAASSLENLTTALRRGRLADLGRYMRNRLQAAAESLLPWIGRARALFDELDCHAHQLSGSGTAYFGLCRHAAHARRLASVLQSRQLGMVYALRSCP